MHEVHIKSITCNYRIRVFMLIPKYFKPLKSIQDLKSTRKKQSSKCQQFALAFLHKRL
jgi:hypothetical protein